MIAAAATNKKEARLIITLRKQVEAEQKLLDALWQGHSLVLLLLLKLSIVYE
jgi:hypothetical protein